MLSKDASRITRRLHHALEAAAAAKAAATQGQIHSVQSYVDGSLGGSLDRVIADAHPDVTLDIFAPAGFSWIRHAHGTSELRRALEQNCASMIDQHPTIAYVVAEGDIVVLMGREQGRLRVSLVPYDVEFVMRFTFHEGLLSSVRIIAADAVADPDEMPVVA